MQTASVLLTIQSPADDVHVPGKLFEYIGARRPILAVSQPCEVTELVSKNNLGWVAEPNAESVAATLALAYRAWRAGTAATAPAERFAVGEQTRQLAELLHRVSR